MARLDHLKLRILIGAGSFSDAAAALRLVERLPQPLFSGLGGLFIEEPDLFTTCAVPHQQVVLPSGATTLAPTTQQIRQLLRADARAFQQAVCATAETAQAGWFFAQDQGDLIASSLHAAKEWDVLLMGYRRVHAKTGKVILLTRSNTISETIAAVAESLSHKFATNHDVFSIDTPENTEYTERKSHSHRFDTLDACLHALARTSCLVVLLDLAEGPVQSPTDLTRVLEAARCPVMAFGARTVPPALEDKNQTSAASGNGAEQHNP